MRMYRHWGYNVVLTSIKYETRWGIRVEVAVCESIQTLGYNIVLTSIKYKPAGEVGWR